MPAPLSAQVLLALVPVPFPVPSLYLYLCLCLSLICIINIDVLSPVSTCSLFCCHCLFSVRRPNELHSPRLKSLSLSSNIALYIHKHTYRHIYSIGSCLGSVCKCNCNCSCSLWIMKDESTWVELNSFIAWANLHWTRFLFSLFHFPISTHPYIVCFTTSLLQSIINHNITEIPKQSEGYN